MCSSRNLLYFFSLILISLLTTTTQAQIKFEKESKVKPEEVPHKARSFLEGVPFDKNVKWIKEESQRGFSYEAKTKYNGQFFSIEFDTLGNIEDVEIDIPLEEILPEAKQIIKEYFDSNYDKVKVENVQKQWTGDPDVIMQMLITRDESLTHTLHYEIVVRTTKSKIHKLFEYLFTDSGEIVRRDEIIPRNSDNLDF